MDELQRFLLPMIPNNTLKKNGYNLTLPPCENIVEILKDDDIHCNVLGVIQTTKYGCDIHFDNKHCDITDRKSNKLLAHG